MGRRARPAVGGHLWACLAACLAMLSAGTIAVAQTELPVPRYVSLRADEANLRRGPGSNYPVEWVYQRPRLPLQITAELDNWRRVRDWEGTEGWMHRRMLSGSRTAIVVGQIHPLRSEPGAASPVVARLEPGVIVELIECAADWCLVGVGDLRGWLGRDTLWGVDPTETIR